MAIPFFITMPDDTFALSEFPNESLDYVLGMPLAVKREYFHKLIESFYPKTLKTGSEYENLLESYMSSFYTEKLYRSNRFFNEKFTIIYTHTGIIRNIVNDLYFTDDELITH